MNPRLILFPALLALATATARGESWLLHPRWDEGLAEVALMEGKVRRYGVMRDVTVDAITVREYFDPERMVKTSPAEGKPTLPVMKLNLLRRFRTGVYEYVQMSSAFVHREEEKLVKLTVVSSEWCGNSSVVAVREPSGDLLLRIANYMDDRGLSERRIPPANIPIFREQLILHFRQHLDRIRPGDPLRLASPLMSNDPVYITESTAVSRVERDTDEIRVLVSFPAGKETFTFANDELRTWTGWSNARGETLRLRKVMFLDYWNRNQPGDEALLN